MTSQLTIIAIVFGPIILVTLLRKLTKRLREHFAKGASRKPLCDLTFSEPHTFSVTATAIQRKRKTWAEPDNSVGKFWRN